MDLITDCPESAPNEPADATAESLRLLRLFLRIKDPVLRGGLIALAETLVPQLDKPGELP